jgi:thiamine pyrophosphokinase
MPPDRRTAIVLADGAAPDRATLDAAWAGWDAGLSFVVAADGGARHAAPLGLRVDRWVGDGDSIEAGELEALRAAGVAVSLAPSEKDESDAELAVMAAVDAGADALVVLGALGGARVDHSLANVGLLAHPALEGRPAVLYDERGARISLFVAPGPGDAGVGVGAGGVVARSPVTRELWGAVGDLVSLIPVGETATGVTTRGLRYPLVGEALLLGRTRGVSNVRTEPVAAVTLERGRLLVIETPATVRP